jgi:hypothetical protein
MGLDGCLIILLNEIYRRFYVGDLSGRRFSQKKLEMSKQKFSKQEQEDYKNSLLLKKLTPSQISQGLQITTGAEIGVIMDGDRIINPHVPLFMQKTPWYTTDEEFKGRVAEKGVEGWYDRGGIVKVATKYRKGMFRGVGTTI